MSASQQTDPLIGQLVDGRYRVRGRIARGGMATVYIATDLRLERRVALKVMHSHLSDDSVFQSRFIQEARAAARLADPHVVNVYDQGQDGELAYLVMEYLPGITLRELLREQRRLTLTQTITVMDAVLSGLAAAHAAGIMHRDVKPENVLLAEDGRIKIGDFGLARATSANTATGQQLLGTIAYLAPELVTRGIADARSDIYALGIMLYELLTGEQPYKGDQPMQIAFQHATEQVPRPSIRNAHIPEALDELVLWATERDPADRPRDAREMLDRLREIEDEIGIHPEVTAPAAPPIAPPARPFTEATSFTQILPGATADTALTAYVEPIDRSNAAILRSRVRRRSRRGSFLLILVLLLALLAGGAGWWFGSGPGSLVAVPTVVGETYAVAAAAISGVGLRPVQATEHHREVPEGRATRTDPPAGERLDRDAQVRVYISLGPAQHTIGALRGLPAEEARGILIEHYVIVPDDQPVFDVEIERDAVTAAVVIPAKGGEPYDCDEGCQLFEGDTVQLHVSLGPVPDVTAFTVADAERALSGSGLEVDPEHDLAFDDDIAEGRVIGLAERSEPGSWQPGDTVRLVVSEGPEPVEVPSVAGLTIRQAADLLDELGFRPISALPENFWRLFAASRTEPAAGTTHPKGTTIQIFGTF